MRFIGALIVFGVLALAANLDHYPEGYVDIPSFVFITGVITGGLLLSFRVRDLLHAFRTAAGRPASPMALESALVVFRRAREITICAGILGMLFGVVSMLTTMQLPGMMPPALALVLLCPLYAAVLGPVLLGSIVANLTSRHTSLVGRLDSSSVERPVPQDQEVTDEQPTLAG